MRRIHWMDETYIKVKGVWKSLYRAVDKESKTVDFLLMAKRAKTAAKRFFDKAMRDNDVPEKATVDKSGANKVGIGEINSSREIPIVVRQAKYPEHFRIFAACGRAKTIAY